MTKENLTWQQTHELIREMLNLLETQKSVTRTISRINYTEVLGVLRNFTIFQYEKNIQIKIDCQNTKLIIQMKRRS